MTDLEVSTLADAIRFVEAIFGPLGLQNQGVVAWAIARSHLSEAELPRRPDLPPHGDAGCWEFYPEFASISEFVCAQAAWHAVRGGLPSVGMKQPFARVSAIAGALGAPAFERAGMRAWLATQDPGLQGPW